MKVESKDKARIEASILDGLWSSYYDYSDEIPETMVNSADKERYKVQKGWFNRTAGYLERAKNHGLIPDEIRHGDRGCEAFCNYCTYQGDKQTGFSGDGPTTQAELDWANEVLQGILDYHQILKKDNL